MGDALKTVFEERLRLWGACLAYGWSENLGKAPNMMAMLSRIPGQSLYIPDVSIDADIDAIAFALGTMRQIDNTTYKDAATAVICRYAARDWHGKRVSDAKIAQALTISRAKFRNDLSTGKGFVLASWLPVWRGMGTRA